MPEVHNIKKKNCAVCDVAHVTRDAMALFLHKQLVEREGFLETMT